MKKYITLMLLLSGLSLTAQAQKVKDHNFEVAKHLDIFNQLYKNLELLYVACAASAWGGAVGVAA